jgi:hypothetical protein
MFKSGLELYELWNENAAKFLWQGLDESANPYSISERWRKERRGVEKGKGGFVSFGGVLTIVIFGLGYVGLLVAEGYDQWQSPQPQATQNSCIKAG